MGNSKILENIIKKREDEYKEIEKELETLKAPFNDFIRMLKIILKATEANTAEEIEEIFDTFTPIENEEHEELSEDTDANTPDEFEEIIDTFPPIENEEHEESSEDTDDPLMPLKDILTENKIKDVRNILILLDVALPLMRIFIHQVKKKPRIINEINCYFESLNITPLNRKEAFEYLHTLQYKERVEILSITSNASKLDIHISNNNFEGFEQELSKTEKGTDEMLKTISTIKQLETLILIIQEGILLSMHNNDEGANILQEHLENKTKETFSHTQIHEAAESFLNNPDYIYSIYISCIINLIDYLSEASIKHIKNIIQRDEYETILRPIHLQIIYSPIYKNLNKANQVRRTRDFMTKIYGIESIEVQKANEILDELQKEKKSGRPQEYWLNNIKDSEKEFGAYLKKEIWDDVVTDLEKKLNITTFGKKRTITINPEQKEEIINAIGLGFIASCFIPENKKIEDLKITSSFMKTANEIANCSINTVKKYYKIFIAIENLKRKLIGAQRENKIHKVEDYENSQTNTSPSAIINEITSNLDDNIKDIFKNNYRPIIELQNKYKPEILSIYNVFVYNNIVTDE